MVVQRNFSVEEVNKLGMKAIEAGFIPEDVHDFTLEEVVNSKNEIKKVVKFKRPDMSSLGFVQTLPIDEEVPEVLRGLEIFTAPYPFEKYNLEDEYESFGWTFSTNLLAFQKGYIDGFVGKENYFFNTVDEEGIIVVDPSKRQAVREYFEKEYQEALEHCKEEDFQYSILIDWSYMARIGTDPDESLEEILQRIKKDHQKRVDEGRPVFNNPDEIASVEAFGLERVQEALAYLLYYTTDMRNIWGQRTAKPLVFNTKEEAEKFKEGYLKETEVYKAHKNREVEIILVNEKFEDWFFKKVYLEKED